MKAAVATGAGDIDTFIHVKNEWTKPTLSTTIDGKTGNLVETEKQMIIRVLACALAPGDCRLFSGKTDMFQLPKFDRLYVIGSDGIVTETSDGEEYFQVGDKVIAGFDEPQPHGMCAEFACVKTELSEKCPHAIPAIEACTLPASAAAAKLVVDKYVQEGDRVLLLGASGGVGTFLVQYAKIKSVEFLAATTTQENLAKSLGVDRVIHYRVENWWEMETELQANPFDLVVDLVNGRNWYTGACSGTRVLKRQAKYVQLVSGVETEIDARGLGMLYFVGQMIARSIYSKLNSTCPRLITPQALNLNPGDLQGILDYVARNRIRVVLDPASPFSFETESVRNAMKLQKSIHAHGKVVVEIQKE